VQNTSIQTGIFTGTKIRNKADLDGSPLRLQYLQVLDKPNALSSCLDDYQQFPTISVVYLEASQSDNPRIIEANDPF